MQITFESCGLTVYIVKDGKERKLFCKMSDTLPGTATEVLVKALNKECERA